MAAAKLAKILLIEDDPADAELTMRGMASAEVPHEVQHFSKGDDALIFLRAQQRRAAAELPRLIVLDLNLPGKDGKDILRELKQDDALRHLRVVVFSTSALPADREQAYQLGADDYVQKAADFREFIKRVVGMMKAL